MPLSLEVKRTTTAPMGQEQKSIILYRRCSLRGLHDPGQAWHRVPGHGLIKCESDTLPPGGPGKKHDRAPMGQHDSSSL